VASGVKDVTLVGQNVNSYGTDRVDGWTFPRLLREAGRVRGLFRLRFATNHPKDLTEELGRTLAEGPPLCPALNLPLQAGSDRVLALMNRGYTVEDYAARVAMLRRYLPDVGLTSDLIVGFPGETEEEFNATLELVRIARFDEAYTYAYSPREGTAAFSMRETIPREEKLARLATLIEVQRAVSREKLIARVGRTEQVIVEAVSRKSSSEVMGKTWLNHPVVLPGGAGDIGRKLAVTITEVKGSTLYAGAIA